MSPRRVTIGQVNCTPIDSNSDNGLVTLRHSSSPKVSQYEVEDNSNELFILRKVYSGYLIVTIFTIIPLEIWSTYLVIINGKDDSIISSNLNIVIQSILQILQLISIAIGFIGLSKRKLSLLGIHLILSILISCLTVSSLAISSILWIIIPFSILLTTSLIKCTAILILNIIQREMLNQHLDSPRFYLSIAAIY